ncbi:hypothetical protein [Amycolatopsis keratiniphila]|uniref:Uncharacterized protein n=1 Tax=Amycolatopsis keratiniphila TaxID=129921 RepID=R4TEI0_9PSEU|nr:hypothetical protein [Amycolatopsis keratiniphila]AGM09177.1 hypothetical protein AORI_6594 [Amycolatopsis keratiniphila]
MIEAREVAEALSVHGGGPPMIAILSRSQRYFRMCGRVFLCKVRDAYAKADPTYVNVLPDLAASDQDFCLAANAELVSLLDSIKSIESVPGHWV